VGQGPMIAAEAVTGAGARILSRVENGLVRTYAMAVIAGAAIVGAILILAR